MFLGPARKPALVAVFATLSATCALMLPSVSAARETTPTESEIIDLVAASPAPAARFQAVLRRLSVDRIGDLRGEVFGGTKPITMGARAGRGQLNFARVMGAFRAGQLRLAEGRASRLEKLIATGPRTAASALEVPLDDARAAAAALRGGRPLLEYVRVKLSEPATSAAARIASNAGIQIVPVPSAAHARAASPGDVEAGDLPASVYAPRYAVVGTDYMPLGDAYPPPPPGTRGQQLKHHYASFKWADAQHLSWYSEGAHRGFEIQIEPMTEDEIWSDGWADPIVVNWSSDMPSPYLDDLAFDGPIKGFAVGSGDGAALEPGWEYFAEWETNEGKTDTGRARALGQATVGPAETTTFNTPSGGPVTRGPGSDGGLAESAYCATHPQDSGCFFARDSVEFGVYRIEDRVDFGPVGLVRYGSCPSGMIPATGDLGTVCAWNT